MLSHIKFHHRHSKYSQMQGHFDNFMPPVFLRFTESRFNVILQIIYNHLFQQSVLIHRCIGAVLQATGFLPVLINPFWSVIPTPQHLKISFLVQSTMLYSYIIQRQKFVARYKESCGFDKSFRRFFWSFAQVFHKFNLWFFCKSIAIHKHGVRPA